MPTSMETLREKSEAGSNSLRSLALPHLFENGSREGSGTCSGTCSGLGVGLQGAHVPNRLPTDAVSLLRSSDVRPKCPHPHDSSQAANS